MILGWPCTWASLAGGQLGAESAPKRAKCRRLLRALDGANELAGAVARGRRVSYKTDCSTGNGGSAAHLRSVGSAVRGVRGCRGRAPAERAVRRAARSPLPQAVRRRGRRRLGPALLGFADEGWSFVLGSAGSCAHRARSVPPVLQWEGL